MKNSNNQTSSAGASAKKARVGFNFIDVLLIAFILAFVLLAVNIISPMSFINGLFKDESQTIYYTVEFSGVDEEYIDMIYESETVIDAVSKNTLGTVTAVENTQHTSLEYNELEGNSVLAVYEGKYNVIVTITASGKYTEGKGYSVNDCRIAVGEKMSLRFTGFTGECYCIALSTEE